MEMEQDCHCVTMNGGGSGGELLHRSLSASSSSSMSSNSSSQSLPTNNAWASSPPPRPPTALPPTREQVLKSIKESIPHEIMLRKLQQSEREYQKDWIRHKKSVRRLSKELYVIVSLYALLQGVVFTAVAQSTVFTCSDWWGPAIIAVLVTLGTIHTVVHKLHRMGCQKQEVKEFERRQAAVYDKITLLYFKGSACRIEALAPARTDTFSAEPGVVCIFSAQGLLVLGFLVGFSALILISCNRMLCSPCHC